MSIRTCLVLSLGMLCCAVVTSAQAPPVVTTTPATGVSTTMATLNGTVNANGESTTVTFEYGTTNSYGSTVTAAQSPVTGAVDTAVSRSISGLANSTTYHFRAVASSANGTVYGDDMEFVTGGAAPTATTNAATGIVGTSATLNGTVNANGSGTTVVFEYGTDTGYGSTVLATPDVATGNSDTAVSAAVTGLLPFETYHFRVVATNGNGTTNGVDMTFGSLPVELVHFSIDPE